MTDDGHGHAGLSKLLSRPLIDTIFRRRTHRVSRGAQVVAGSMSYTPDNPPQPLTSLEEALLIATTGCTGLTMPDRPFADPRDATPIMAKPNINMAGRTAGSPDNAQGTYYRLDHRSTTDSAPAIRRKEHCVRAQRACEGRSGLTTNFP